MSSNRPLGRSQVCADAFLAYVFTVCHRPSLFAHTNQPAPSTTLYGAAPPLGPADRPRRRTACRRDRRPTRYASARRFLGNVAHGGPNTGSAGASSEFEIFGSATIAPFSTKATRERSGAISLSIASHSRRFRGHDYLLRAEAPRPRSRLELIPTQIW